VAVHRQNQVRQLEDTWSIDGLCIYNYQLATQVDRIDKFIHPYQKSLTSLPYTLERKKKMEAFPLTRARLSSYLYRLCIMCVNPSMLGVVSTPP
jgi:hypothetical protein